MKFGVVRFPGSCDEVDAVLACEQQGDAEILWHGDRDGRIVVGDEVFTPDSSRFWPATSYKSGGPQPSFDKQYVRDWASATGWDKKPPAPAIPDDVVAGTRRRYVEAYERITGRPFSAWLERVDA